MNNTDEMQRLHQLSVSGGTLTEEETAALNDWYKNLDEEENSVLSKSAHTQDTQEKISVNTQQISEMLNEIEALMKQNAILRDENKKLKKIVENRLLEKVA